MTAVSETQARNFASNSEIAQARDALTNDLNVVMSSLLAIDEVVENRILEGDTLNDVLRQLDSAASIDAIGLEGQARLTLLYDSKSELLRPGRSDRRRSFDLHTLMAELSNQYLGAICNCLPAIRQSASMSPPVLSHIGRRAIDLVVDHACSAQSDSAILNLGWASTAPDVNLFTFTLLTITQHGKRQAQIARELAGATRDEEEVLWFVDESDVDEMR